MDEKIARKPGSGKSDTDISKTESPYRVGGKDKEPKVYGVKPPRLSIDEIDDRNSPPTKAPSSDGSTSVRV